MVVRLPVIQSADPPRPVVVGDCTDGPRPCPRVSCRFNLLIDVMEDGGLVLNAPSKRLAGADRVFPDRRAIERQWYVEVNLLAHEGRRQLEAARARGEALESRIAARSATIRFAAEERAGRVLVDGRRRSDAIPRVKSAGRTPAQVTAARARRSARVGRIMAAARARAAKVREVGERRVEMAATRMRSSAAQNERRRVFMIGPLDSAARARELADRWAIEHGAGTAAVHRDWPTDLVRAGLIERDIDAAFRDELEDAIEHWFDPEGEPVASCLLDEIKTLDRSQLDCLLDGIARRMFVSRERVRQVLGSGVGKFIAASPDTAIEEDIDMADKTRIAWCDHTFNLWIGCEHAPRDAPAARHLPGPPGLAELVGCQDLEPTEPLPTAPECDHCYAEAFDRRYGGEHWGPDAPRRLLSDDYWRKPLKWNAAAERAGKRAQVFCSSLADWAEILAGERGRLLDEQRARLWELIPRTPWLDWLLLTKRIENVPALLPWYRDGGGEPWQNVWIGTTCGARSSLWRVDQLRQVRAAIRFISGEPLLERLTAEDWDRALGGGEFYGVDQLIIGDESGPGRRPADPAWVRDARDAAARHGVAFLFKQWNGPTGGDVGIAGVREGGKRTIHLPVLDGRVHAARPVR